MKVFKPKTPLKLPTYLQICAMIFIITAFTTTVMTSRSLGGEYYHLGAKAGVTVFLMGVLSLSLFYGLISNNRKLLFWTCSIEFIILLLPFLPFDAQADYLPYAIVPIFIVSFPLLWILLPIAFFYLIQNEKKEKECMISLRAMTVFLLIAWILSGVFNYMRADAIILFLMFLIVPLGFWELGYRASRRSIKFDLRHTLKAIDKISKNFAVFSLFALIALILLFGYLWAMPPQEECGNLVCEVGEDSYSCPWDCGPICGDGYCDYYYYEDDYCDEDCKTSTDIRVYIDGAGTGGSPDCQLTTKLYSSDGELIGTISSYKRSAHFSSVDADSVYAVVVSEDTGKRVPSENIYTDSRSTIRIYAPDDFCLPPMPPDYVPLEPPNYTPPTPPSGFPAAPPSS